MKKLPLILLLFMLFMISGSVRAQIRLVEVDPTTDFVSIKNFGAITMDISGYRLCARFAYTSNLSSLTIESGDLNLAAGATVVVSGFSLNNTSSDLGLYLATGAFGSASAMVDFTQWGAGGIGRESVAVAKGIWTTGDFIEGDAPYQYIGNGSENGLEFWQATLNTETDIITYSFEEQTSPADIDPSNHTVDIEVGFGTDLTDLVASFALSDGATAQVNTADQTSGNTSNDFTDPVTYTIMAEDGITLQDWIITVATAPNDEANIISYVFPEQTGTPVIGDGTVDVEVAQGTDLTSLVATFTVSANASVQIGAVTQVSGVTPNDFTNPVTYTVMAQDGITEKDWVVTVVKDLPPSMETDFLSFDFSEQTGPAMINTGDHSISVEVEFGTDITALTAIFTLSGGATATILSVTQVSGITINNFTDPVSYQVTAEDGVTTQDWIVSVTVALNTETGILSFSIPDELGDAQINESMHTIDIEVNSEADLSDQVATFTLSFGAVAEVNSVPQNSGTTSNDFTDPLTYRIFAEDGVTFQDWIITVTIVLNDKTEFLAFSIPEQTKQAEINPSNRTISIEIEPGTDITSLVATFELSFGASAEVESVLQISGTTVNDFTSSVTYTLTAEDGITVQDWTISVILDPQTDFLAFSFPEETSGSNINSQTHTISIEVEFGTDLNGLVASFELSQGATAEIAGIPQTSGLTANDFTQPVTYKVISQGGSATQNWIITVSIALSNETDFLTYSLAEQTGPAVIDFDNHTIAIEIQPGNDSGSLIASFTLSAGASAWIDNDQQESGITQNDFTNPVTYLVVAEDGTTEQEWIISVSIAPNDQTEILTFSFKEQTGSATILGSENSIVIEVVFGTAIEQLIAEFELSTGATAEVDGVTQVSGVTLNDFTNPLVYKIIAENGTTEEDWIVAVTLAPNSETDFLSFNVPEQIEPSIINTTNHFIDVLVSFGTDLSSLVASFTLSEGAVVSIGNVSQESGVTVNDFSGATIYTVTAEDGITTQDWTICVSLAPNTETDILGFSFPEQSTFESIDKINATVDIEIHSEADITDLVATFTLSMGATAEVNGVFQESGVTSNDYSMPVVFTIIAEDGVIKRDWTITVTQQSITSLNGNFQSNDLSIYPNPVNDKIKILFENDYRGPVILTLRDSNGKELNRRYFQKGERQFSEYVNIKSFRNRLLFLEIRYDQLIISQRIIKR